jgi:hypothetical protein
MPSPRALPLEARRAAWSRLWQVLLREPPSDAVEQQEFESDSEQAETHEAAACAESGVEETMRIP